MSGGDGGGSGSYDCGGGNCAKVLIVNIDDNVNRDSGGSNVIVKMM